MTKTEERAVWQARVAAYRGSGQTVAAWCRTQGIKPHQMYYWIKRLNASAPPSASKPAQWLPLVVEDQEASNTDKGLLVRVGPAVIEVPAGFDPELLTAVVRVLKTSC